MKLSIFRKVADATDILTAADRTDADTDAIEMLRQLVTAGYASKPTYRIMWTVAQFRDTFGALLESARAMILPKSHLQPLVYADGNRWVITTPIEDDVKTNPPTLCTLAIEVVGDPTAMPDTVKWTPGFCYPMATTFKRLFPDGL